MGRLMPAERGKHSAQQAVAGDALRFALRAPEPHRWAASASPSSVAGEGTWSRMWG